MYLVEVGIGKGKGVKIIHLGTEINISLIKRKMIGIEAPLEVEIIKASDIAKNRIEHVYINDVKKANEKKKV